MDLPCDANGMHTRKVQQVFKDDREIVLASIKANIDALEHASDKLKNELGWEPSLQFEEGLAKTIAWYLDNEKWMDNITSGDYQKYYEQQYS